MRYFISDCHFNHWNDQTQQGIISFERTNFSSIGEHDMAIVNMIHKLCKKLKPNDEVWNLGDFGSLKFLFISNLIRETGAKSYFVYGNHDKLENLEIFERYFDQVYRYPIYLSQKLVVSHFPVAVYPDSINIHGHTHNAKLQDINHICASIHVAKYQPITDKYLDSCFSKIPKFTRRFLYEPWASDYQFIAPKEDVVMNPDGIIDLSASRLMQKLNIEKCIKNNNEYQPYHGEGDFSD